MIRRALSLLCAALVGMPVLVAAPARTEAAVNCTGDMSSSALNEMIRGGIRGPGGMVGMDYAHVHRLPDGRVLWLFQDVFIGNVGNLNAAKFVHNAGLVQFGSCVKLLRAGTSKQPRSWIGSTRETTLARWFWPLDGTMGADGRFHQFMVEMRNPKRTGAAPGATPVRVWIASIRLSDMKVMSFSPAPDDGERPLFGFSITSDDRWTYLYGNCYRQFTQDRPIFRHDETCGPGMYLARVPKGKVTTRPQYWSGVDWVGGRSDARTVSERGTFANPMQIRYLDGLFVSATKPDDWWGDRVYLETSTRPEGPWTQVATFTVDVLCDGCNTYFAHILPWRDSNGAMLVSVSNNSWDFPLARDNPLLYRPRIISVRNPEGVRLPDPPADCVVNRTLKRGVKHVEVLCLRRRLAQLGYAVDLFSRTFDATLQSAVKDFQRDRGLAVDGIAGPNTGKLLGIRGVRTVTP